MEANEPKEIDLIQLFRHLLGKWKFIAGVTAALFAVGMVAYVSTPNEYRSTAKLLAEDAQSRVPSGLAGMLGGVANMSTDAITSSSFPDIVKTRPMLAKFLDLEVQTIEGEPVKLFEYLVNEQRFPWWQYITKPGLWKSHKINPQDYVYDTCSITPLQGLFFGRLSESFEVVLEKNAPNTVTVTMQDPHIAFQTARLLMQELEVYISDYRTLKARRNLHFSELQLDSARKNYVLAQEKLARFEDANQNMISRFARTEWERLRNDFSVATSVYGTLATQTETLRLELQKAKPVYVVLEPLTLQPGKIAPGLFKYAAISIFLGLFFGAGYVVITYLFCSGDKSKQSDQQ